MATLTPDLEVKSIARSTKWYRKVGFRVKKGRIYNTALLSYGNATVELSVNPQKKKPGTTKGLVLDLLVSPAELKKIARAAVRNHIRIGWSYQYKKGMDKERNYFLKEVLKHNALVGLNLTDPDGHYWLVSRTNT